jgi:hypothetical protein
MRSVIVLALFAIGCSKEIGDECVVSSDCDPNGERLCDSSSVGGYCTIQGCDVDTCPDEALCVRFFTGSFVNKQCTQQSECSLDELCSLSGTCVPRSSETRFCMRKCDDDSDCRDGYECRDENLMIVHGGEPIVRAGEPLNDHKFCASGAP